jgi:hypothetical protein
MTKTLIGCTIQPNESVSAVILLETGKVVNKVIDASNQYFNTVVDALRDGDQEKAIKYLVGFAPIVDSLTEQHKGYGVRIEYGVVYFNGMVIENVLTKRILRMLDEGFDIKPLELFLENLMQNPSSSAVNELYLFLEANDLSITSDGYFLAYKSVNENFTSIHDGKTDNSIGSKPSMPRNMVDDNRDRTCSQGLHFASLDYCKNHFVGDRILALKINPKDVVSIPSDYNNQKGRACTYEIIAEVTDEVKVQNRDPLSEQAVVDLVNEIFGEINGASSGRWNDKLSIAQNVNQNNNSLYLRDSKGRFVKT